MYLANQSFPIMS